MEQSAENSQVVTGIILAGGYSKRFGMDKWNVRWNGSPMIDHVAASLSAACGQLEIVCRADQPVSCRYAAQIVNDDPELAPGPLRGMIAGLRACMTPLAIVAACDTPCIRAELAKLLVEHGKYRLSAGSMGVVPRWRGRRQPLVALYLPHAAEQFAETLAKGIQSVNRSLELLPHDVLSHEECRRADPEGISFFNVNSSDDLLQLTDMIRQD